MAESLIATAAGEFVPSYLAKEATKIGIKQFIQTYGSVAFRTIAPVITGGMLFAKAVEAYPPVDLQQDKLFGYPLSRMTGQEQAYDDTKYFKKPEPLKYIPEIHGGKPLPPIEQESFPAKTEVEPVQEGFKKPEPIEPLKGFEVPPQEKKVPPGFEIPKTVDTSILTKDKPKDITKQTKDLVKEKPEFGALTEVEKQTAIALKGDKPDFYSRAIKSIEDAKPDKLTKTKWKSYIQSTKEELDYLGLTEFLKGSESITKQELLDFVKGKDLAATMIVYPIPKIEMNPMYEGYSLGFEKSGTQEHIVFQIGKDKGEVGQLYKEPHLNIKHGTGTFAHSRVQVGYDPNITSEHKKEAKYTGEDIKLKKFNNTLIIDEIQSQWIQTGQDKGFVSDFDIVPGENLLEYLKNNNIEYRISGKGKNTRDIEMQGKPGVWEDELGSDPFNENMDYIFNKNEKSLRFIYDPEEETKYSTPEEFLQKAYGIVPDLPLKDSKKFVELVLNEMVRKAVKDGRDSIAITNGQIQYNRYEAMGEKERQGLKKFYDTFVYDQLNKIAKNYGVKLERIDISEGEAPKELQDSHLDNQIKRAQDNEYKLKKVTLQFLFDRVQDTDIPGHAALYSNEGRGQGHDYIEEWLNTLVDNRTGGIPATLTTEEGLSDRGLKRWEKIRQNEIYIWIQERDVSRDLIGWDLPIVVKSHAINHAPELQSTITSAEKQYLKDEQRSTDDNDLELYKKYLKDFKVPPGQEIGPEQLIKMKLPKKLQNDILKKSIRLTEVKPPIEDQTQRLFT